jgi:hypothetical protein
MADDGARIEVDEAGTQWVAWGEPADAASIP